jgi:zinc/manganese transport system substrate-binding protein
MKRQIALFVVACALGASPSFAQAKLNVMTTTEDLAAIAREVGGDRVTVESMARGYQYPHFVEAKPSCWSRSAASSRSDGCRR